MRLGVARRQYGTGSVHQRKSDGRWIGTLEAGWTRNGTRRRVSATASTEAECRKRLKVKAELLATDGAPAANPRTTVKAWSDEWLVRTQRDIRPKSWNANRSAVRQWIVPTLGHIKVAALTSRDIENFKDAMRDKLAPSSISRTHNVLNKMLNDAVVEGFRIHPGVMKVKKIAPGKTTRTSLPLPQALKVLAEVEREPDPSRWVAMMLNGMRQGETLGLLRDHIDFEEHIIRVRWQLAELPYKSNKDKHLGFRIPDNYEVRHLVDRWHLVPPKTESGNRDIPMTPWFEAALRQHLERAPYSPYGLVWCEPDGMPIDPKTDRENWRRLQDVADIAHRTGRHYDVHEGRHTTVTLLLELGVDRETVAKIVGQRKLVEAYDHSDLMPKARAALEQLGERLALGQ